MKIVTLIVTTLFIAACNRGSGNWEIILPDGKTVRDSHCWPIYQNGTLSCKDSLYRNYISAKELK